MKKTLYLHIGTEKTGTTTIQSTFHLNKEKLAKKSINYPSIGYYSQAQFSLVTALINEQTGKRFEVAPKDWNKTKLEEWNELFDNIRSSDCEKHFVCVEHFSSRLNEASIKWLSSILKQQTDIDVKIICYFRRPDKYLVSSFSTAVKAGDKRTFKEFKKAEESNLERYDHYLMFSKWAKCFSEKNIICRVFEKNKLFNGDVVDDILRLLDVECDFELKRSKKPNDENISWHPKTLRLAIFINGNQRLINKLKDKRLKFLNKIDAIFKRKYPKFNFSYLSDVEAIAFNDKFKSGTSQLSKIFFQSEDKLFNEVNSTTSKRLQFDSIELFDAIELLTDCLLKDTLEP